MIPAAIEAVLKGKWLNDAACRDIPPDQANWFPNRGQANDHRTKQALHICSTCPVREDCLASALIHDVATDRGIFGGLTAKQRAHLRARMHGNPRNRITAQLVEVIPIVRICANPACRKRFTVTSPNSRRDMLCSKACRLARRRLRYRTAKINRA